MVGFLAISLITAIVSFISYTGMKKLETKFNTVIESAPLIETAINMKLTVSQDLMMVVKLMSSLDTEELDAVWKIHESNVSAFSIYKKAILEGAVIDGKSIFPAKDKALLDIVKSAGSDYETQVLPNFKTAYEQMYKQLSAEPYDYDLLDTIDEITVEKGRDLSAKLDKVIESAQALIAQARADVGKEKARVTTLIWSATLVGIGVALILGFTLSGRISTPVKKADAFIQTVAKGDFTQSIEISSKDEIASMVRAMNDMVAELAGAFKQISAGVVTLNQTSGDLSTVSGDLETRAGQMSDRSGAVSDAAANMSETMSSVAASSDQSSSNLDSVSAAIEEMNQTISGIAKNTGEAKSITRTAVSTAKSASEKVDSLGDDAKEIGQFTDVIAEISGQTNLLALNATIEAARAGEAGKGFAVVANEIKELADQTASAARNIAEKIEKIQASTIGTVNEIEQISKVVDEVDSIVGEISTAIEQQSDATGEISDNIGQAALGIRETHENILDSSNISAGIAEDISSVSTNAGAVSRRTQDVNESAGKIKDFANRLNDILGRFKV
ncbi:MAG: methyl-accepting chemotaxis protein [Desulfobacterales bacterium]|nr:methyl-accepting chemotaxis protein [Desulfobacterales bacterium]